jgi:hypothetical protein
MRGVPVSITGVKCKETGYGRVRRTTFVFTNARFDKVDDAGVVGYIAAKLYDFAEGVIFVKGATIDLQVARAADSAAARLSDTFDGDIALGTTANAHDASMATTEANIVASTAIPQAVAGVATASGQSTAVAFLNGAVTPVDLYLNLNFDDADQDGAAVVELTGTVDVHWEYLGNPVA